MHLDKQYKKTEKVVITDITNETITTEELIPAINMTVMDNSYNTLESEYG